MDEVLFRSSQKFENLQVQVELAATKGKDIIQQYSQQSKSLALQAWNSTRAQYLRDEMKQAYLYIVAITQELQERFLYTVNPRRIYMNLMKILGKNWTKRDVYFACAGFLVGGMIGISIGLAIRRRKSTIRYMRAIQCNNYLGIESATVVEDAVAPYKCGDYDVLINVKAASVHIIDAQICEGYGRNLGRILRKINKQLNSDGPVIIGRDCSGVITDLGRKVNRLEVGDEVWVTVPFWSQGTLCQTILVSENRVSKKPKNIGFEGACSLPYAGSLALSTLQKAQIDFHNAQEKRILVQGGCTPVGCVLIQILNHWKANVTATCSPRALPVAKALGAEDIIVISESTTDNKSSLNVEDPQVISNALQKELEIRGPIFDVVINTKDYLPTYKLYEYCKQEGRVISTLPPILMTDSCGFFSSMVVEAYIRIRFLLENLLGLPTGNFDETHLCYVSLDKLAEFVEDGFLQTVVDKVFHPEDIEVALYHIKSNRSIGSTVITFR